MTNASPRAIAEWVVSVAAPAALRKLDCPEEAEVLEALGCGPHAVITARLVIARDVGSSGEAAERRRRVAHIVIAAVELYDLAPTVAFQDPLVKRAEPLAREIGTFAGMVWSEGGEA